MMNRADMRRLGGVAWIVALLAVACQDDAPRCTPGATAQCACTDGRLGAQRCNNQGILEACVCAGTPPKTGHDGGADAPASVQDGAATDAIAPDTLAANDVTDDAAQNESGVGDADRDAGTVAGDQGTEDSGIAPPDAERMAQDASVRPPDTGTPSQDSGTTTPDASTAPGDSDVPVLDAGVGPPGITGSFVGGQVVSSPELSGLFSWGAPVYATGGGITLEGSFQ